MDLVVVERQPDFVPEPKLTVPPLFGATVVSAPDLGRSTWKPETVGRVVNAPPVEDVTLLRNAIVVLRVMSSCVVISKQTSTMMMVG